MFSFRSIPVNELSDKEVSTWLDIHRSAARFESPFFHPALTFAMANVREDIRVVVMSEDGQAVGFLPIEIAGELAKPAGYPMSSLHGMVTMAEGWPPEAILQAAGVGQLRFENWISDQPELQASTSVHASCAQIEISQGFDSYHASKRKQGSKIIAESERRARKLAREVGPIHTVRTASVESLDKLVEWKSLQCERTGVANLFDFDWSVELLHNLLVNKADDNFGGELWQLFAGDVLIAVNYVLRSRHVGHGWFMAFDSQFRNYSPGLILLHDILHGSEGLGIKRLDLGKGLSGFKKRWMTQSVEVFEGAIDTRFVTRAAWSQWLKTRDWVRNSRYRSTAHRVDRWLTNTRRIFGGTC